MNSTSIQKKRLEPGLCCYQCGKHWSINYVCSRRWAHYESGKLSVTFCDPIHIHAEYGCTGEALLTSYSRKGHSCKKEAEYHQLGVFDLMLLPESVPTISACTYSHSLYHHHYYIGIIGVKLVSVFPPHLTVSMFTQSELCCNTSLCLCCLSATWVISLGCCGLGNGCQVNLPAPRDRCSNCTQEWSLIGVTVL